MPIPEQINQTVKENEFEMFITAFRKTYVHTYKYDKETEKELAKHGINVRQEMHITLLHELAKDIGYI